MWGSINLCINLSMILKGTAKSPLSPCHFRTSFFLLLFCSLRRLCSPSTLVALWAGTLSWMGTRLQQGEMFLSCNLSENQTGAPSYTRPRITRRKKKTGSIISEFSPGTTDMSVSIGQDRWEDLWEKPT